MKTYIINLFKLILKENTKYAKRVLTNMPSHIENSEELNLNFLNNNHSNSIAYNALRVLMMGWNNPSHWQGLKSWRVFKAIFIKRDHQLLKEMRKAFQEGFNNIYEQLADKVLNDQQLDQSKLYISNCLSVLPFSNISEQCKFTIPQHIKGKWKKIEYKVCPIELTPTSGIETLFTRDIDRVFAYALEPINAEEAEAHLIFMGTTYPAGQGFVTQIDADFEWFNTPGSKLYRSGRNNILAWVNKQKQKIHVCGMSLGGALSLLFALDMPDKISRVDALNPPGLCFNKQYFDCWDNTEIRPEVYIQKQGNDPISYFGFWKKEWQILEVIPKANNRGPNCLTDHALNYAGFYDTTFKKINTEEDNLKRSNRNFWIYFILRSLVYGLFFMPVRYIGLPILRVLSSNKIIIATLLLFMVILPTLNVIIPNFVNYICLGVVAGSIFHQTYEKALTALGITEPKEVECHKQKYFDENTFRV